MFNSRNPIIILLIIVIITSVTALVLYNRSKQKKQIMLKQIKNLEHKLAESRNFDGLTNQLAFEYLVDSLRVYKIYDIDDKEFTFVRLGKENDGGYVVPEKALLFSDVLLGYGVADDISFEEQFSELYNKKSYGFDCTIKSIKINNPLCHFIKECISSNPEKYSKTEDSLKYTSFSQQLESLNLKGEKIFLKMDIEGAEYEAFENIYDYTKDINAIVLEVHLNATTTRVIKAIDLIKTLSKDFYLVHVHANNCCTVEFKAKNLLGKISYAMELTFINKSLVSKAEIAREQKFPLPIDSKNVLEKEDTQFEILNYYQRP